MTTLTSLKRKRSSRTDDSNQVSQLHVKNPYCESLPDFAGLARQYPLILGEYVQINPVSLKGYIDFTVNDATRALTKALLLKDFDVDVDIPKDHLCPPLPNRINYVCWISDLLDGISNQASAVTVLDVGVGPVCIYPILGTKLFDWQFVGSDVDAASVEMCQRNLDANAALKEHIRVVHVANSDKLQERIVREVLTKMPSGSTDPCANAAVVSLLSIRNSLSDEFNKGMPLRGPVSSALHSMGGTCTQTLLECETASDSHIDTNASTKGRIFDVIMTNPPFYDTEEQVRYFVIY